MLNKDNIQCAFIELVKAGLWGVEARLIPYGEVDYTELMRLAEEQSVVGLVTAGLEHVVDVKVPQEILLQFIGQTLQLEQRNLAMNRFIAKLIQNLQSDDIFPVLVKGQGVAQCYEKPLWRACGDVDLYLDEDSYNKAKAVLLPRASEVEKEDVRRMHLGMTLEGWIVELHGTMHTEISKYINACEDIIKDDIFKRGGVRKWENSNIDVYLPCPDNDVIIIFAHFINHFYGGGIGLRQICDWCRLLYTFRKEINIQLLEERLGIMGLTREWMAFASLSVEFLEMPAEAMPFYSKSPLYNKKANRILSLIFKTGNFGHNNDVSYRNKCSKLVSNIITLGKRFKEYARLSTIFPLNAPKFYITYVSRRLWGYELKQVGPISHS